MRAIHVALLRLASLFVRDTSSAEFSAELDAHLQSHIDDNLHAGMTLDEARRDALVRLGGVNQTVAVYREQRGLPMLEKIGRELRQAFARLRRSPGFAVAAVLSLALAIAANVSIFVVVERVVINPLPYPDSARLVALDFGMPSRNIPTGFNSMTAREYFHFAEHARTIESLAVSRTEDRTLTDGASLSESASLARRRRCPRCCARRPPSAAGCRQTKRANRRRWPSCRTGCGAGGSARIGHSSDAPSP